MNLLIWSNETDAETESQDRPATDSLTCRES